MKAQRRRLRSDSASNSMIAPAVMAIAILVSLIGVAIFTQSGSATTTSTLEISADVPPSLGPQTPGTVTVHFTNTGTADMQAPLLVLSSNGNALLTLDQAKSGQALDTASTPPGYSDTIQILANGQTAGVLMAGESASLPVYFCGLVKPWDTSQTSVDFTLSSFETDNTTAIDWAGIKDSMRPDSISAEAWTPIWTNFTANMGGTWGSYVARLDQDAAYLGGLGEKVMDARDLIGFEIMQADGLGPMGSLASSTDASIAAPGLPITFSRSFSGNISGRNQLGPLGRGWSHSWQISLSTAPDGMVTVKGPGGSSRSYYPDSEGYTNQPGDHATLAAIGGGAFTLIETSGLKTTFAADGKLNYIEDTNSNRITAGYTGADLTSLSHSSGQSLTITHSAGRIVSITDPSRGTTSFNYDPAGEHMTSVQDYNGKTTDYSYSEGGGAATEHALTEISFPGGNHDYFDYDGQGRLSQTSKDGNAEVTDFSYGPGGEVDTTDANGTTTRIFIDYRGLTVRTVDPLGNELNSSYDADYNLTGITDPAGKSYAYGYNTQGNMTSSTDPAGHTTQFGYGSLSRMTSLTDANSNSTSYSYDSAGNKDSTTYANGASESWAYDSNGSPTAKTNGRGNTIIFAYDSSGRVTSKEYADGSIFSYGYDPAGHLISTIDSTGTTNFTYDQDLLSRIGYPGGRYLQFTYDNAGRRTSSLDQLGHRLEYHYDSVGRLESMTDETDQEIVRYDYDAAGRLTRKTVGNGGYTNYEYDAASHVLSLVNNKADGEVLSRFDYSYDSRGRRTSMATLDGDWSYEYDDLGQLTHAVFASSNPEVCNQDLTYSYDAMGNRTNTVTNGAMVGYTTNNMNQYTQTHVVQATSLPLSISVGNVYWGSYGDYTARQLSVDVSVRNESNSDAVNVQITGVDSSGGVSVSSGIPVSIGDVRSHTAGTGTLKYQVPTGVPSFRSNFRGVAEDAGGVKHQYPGDTTPDTSYSYDSDGNLVQQSSTNSVTSYSFNDDNRMVGISAPGIISEYIYDANGNRAQTVDNGIITFLMIDPAGLGNVVGEYDNSWNERAGYDYGLGLIEKRDQTDSYFYNYDANGNTSDLTDGSGLPTNKYLYGPFGNNLKSQDGTSNPFQFDGMDGVSKDANGLNSMRNRFYSASIGKFMGQDPIGLEGGINLYSYSGNAPINYRDPKGYDFSLGWWLLSGADNLEPYSVLGWETLMQDELAFLNDPSLGGYLKVQWDGLGLTPGFGVATWAAEGFFSPGTAEAPGKTSMQENGYIYHNAMGGTWDDLGICPMPSSPSRSASYSTGGLPSSVLSISRVSTDVAGGEGNWSSGGGVLAISADGRYVAFSSDASDLIPGDTNSATDVFVKDTQTGAIQRASTDSSGNQTNYSSGGLGPSMSDDGRYVTFASYASNLVPGDTNGAVDVFVKDTHTGAILRASTDLSGNQAINGGDEPSISRNGRFVTFVSSNLIPGNDGIYVKDLWTSAVTFVASGAWGIGPPSISADGRYVSYVSVATNGAWGVFVKDIQTGTISNISSDALGNNANDSSMWPSISANGRYVAFSSNAGNLTVNDTDNTSDVFVKDTQTGAITLVTADATGQGNCISWEEGCQYDFYRPSISPDGRYVSFSSAERKLMPGETNGTTHVYVKDTQTGAIARVSTDTNGNQGNSECSFSTNLTDSANNVVFSSYANNLVPGDSNGVMDVFVVRLH